MLVSTHDTWKVYGYANAYVRFLTLFLFLRVLDSWSLLQMDMSAGRVYDFIRDALKDGYISQINETGKNGRSKRTRIYYCLTRKGFLHLAGLRPEKMPFADELHELCDKNYQLYSKAEFKKFRRVKTGLINIAAVFAYKAGAYIPLEAMTDNIAVPEPGTVLLQNYLAEKAGGVYDKLGIFKNTGPDSKIRFSSELTVKIKLGETNHLVSVRDFLSGRYEGIIDSPSASIMLYVSPLFGMSWRDALVSNEHTAYRNWARRHALAPFSVLKESGSRAALIVKSAREFCDLYTGRDLKLGRKDRFGGRFDHFYILPKNNDGTELLKLLMKYSDKKCESFYIENFLKIKGISRNSSPVFPLIRDDDTYLAIGVFLDARKIEQMTYIADKYPKYKFSVVCLPWQKEYYETVLPNNVSALVLKYDSNDNKL